MRSISIFTQDSKSTQIGWLHFVEFNYYLEEVWSFSCLQNARTVHTRISSSTCSSYSVYLRRSKMHFQAHFACYFEQRARSFFDRQACILIFALAKFAWRNQVTHGVHTGFSSFLFREIRTRTRVTYARRNVKELERLSWIKMEPGRSAVSSRVVFVHRSKLPWA